MGIWKAFFNNTRKPEGLLGKVYGGQYEPCPCCPLADWGLSHLPETGPSQIAELGCGGGRNIRALLRKYPAATITALDYSEISVERAKRVNREGLQAGRCQILQGDVSRLPLGMVRLIWRPHLKPYISGLTGGEFPGGVPHPATRRHFLIVNESDGENSQDNKWLSVIDGMRICNGDQLTRFLTKAGFSKVIMDKDAKKHWLCALAIR